MMGAYVHSMQVSHMHVYVYTDAFFIMYLKMVVKVLEIVLVGGDFITGQVLTCVLRLEGEKGRGREREGGRGKGDKGW